MTESSVNESELNRRFDVIKERYGRYLSDEQLEGVRNGLRSVIEASDILSAAGINMAEEPATSFKPFRKEA